MKKSWLFIFSFFMAMAITFYTKKEALNSQAKNETRWKTYIKNAKSEIISHHTTAEEYEEARIPSARPSSTITRSIASSSKSKNQLVRNNRVVIGDADPKYENADEELEMLNTVAPSWKDDMGIELMRFQDPETKLLVKEERPIIKIQNGKGRYLEEVIVTYLMKNGDQSSFKALVDSDTGALVETWDRTIHEKLKKQREKVRLPSSDDSGIVAR